MTLFGTPAPSNSGGGGGLFGSSFGSATPQQPSGGGLFGSSTPQQQGGGGLFGSSTPQQQQGGGLFGSSTPQQQQGGGLFGSSTPQQQQGGGLFGSSTPQQSGGGGLFGSSTPQQSSGGLFGSSTQQSGGGGLFGSSTPQQQQQQGGLFGSSSNANAGGGLFGSSSNTNTGGGLFGSSSGFGSSQPPPPQQQQQGGLFGSSTSSGGLFGSSQQQQQQPAGGGLFGGQQQQQQGMQMMNNYQQQQQSMAAPWWYRELMAIRTAYQPGQNNRFQTMLYEVVGVAPDLVLHSGAVALPHVDHIKTQRKKSILQQNPWIDNREWQRAEDNNPDPLNWMPSPIIGIDALYKRVEDQAAHVRAQIDMLEQPIHKKQQQPSAQTIGTSTSEGKDEDEDERNEKVGQNNPLWLHLEVGRGFEQQIEQCRHEHIRLKHRLVKALGRLERLQCATFGRRGRTEPEIEFGERLDRLYRALDDPRGCRAQLTQIATQLELEDYNESQLTLSSADLRDSRESSLQEQDHQAIFNFLELQQEGIDSLMKIVRRDMRDLEIIRKKTGDLIGSN